MEINNLYLVRELSILLMDENVRAMANYRQHGNTDTLTHCISVAVVAYRMACRWNLNVDLSSLIRGGLLHDYFLYDWHSEDRPRGHHGFMHPGIARENAVRDFDANEIEQDIIHRHMWPMTVIPPRHLESYLVCLADKWCTLQEVFNPNHNQKILEIFCAVGIIQTVPEAGGSIGYRA